jgi:hypothetical protein
MTDKYTQEELEIISSAFARETDYCVRGGDREAAVRQLYKRLRDIMTQAVLL